MPNICSFLKMIVDLELSSVLLCLLKVNIIIVSILYKNCKKKPYAGAVCKICIFIITIITLKLLLICMTTSDFPGGSDGKASAYNSRDWVQSLGREDPLEKEMATHSSILAWKIPWKGEPGRLQSVHGVAKSHDWATSLSLSQVNYVYLLWKRLLWP